MHSPEVQLLSRYLNGWHGEYIGKYGRGSVTYYSNDLDYCLKDAVEGCVIIDKSVCNDSVISFVINGPMVDLELPENTAKCFSGHDTTGSMLAAFGSGFQFLASQANENREWKGLDYISLDLYVAAWRKLGARIGKYQNGAVEWEVV